MRYQIWYSGDFAKRVSFEICGHGYPIFRSNKIHIDCQHGWFSKLGIPSLNPWKPRLISIFWQMTFSILQYICIDLSDVLLIWNMSLTFLVTQVGPDTVSKRLKRFTVPVSTFLLWKIFKKIFRKGFCTLSWSLYGSPWCFMPNLTGQWKNNQVSIIFLLLQILLTNISLQLEHQTEWESNLLWKGVGEAIVNEDQVGIASNIYLTKNRSSSDHESLQKSD